VSSDETVDQEWVKRRAAASRPQPGLLLVFSGQRPLCAPIAVEGPCELGRGQLRGVVLEDPLISRRHVRITRSGGAFALEDLGSRNGFRVDGVRVPPYGTHVGGSVLRLGDSVFLLEEDLRPFSSHPVDVREQRVVGPSLAQALAQVEAARGGGSLHITGESGAGKELAASTFHAGGPFVAVNCAAIPEGVAERLLFGARKGAYSGAAADAEGYVQTAHGGTLFLDEVAELDLAVQAKLLRVLETREVLALGAARPQRVELRLVSATHKDLRALVADKKFREDLYFRIGRPAVRLPSLRERREEIPFLVELALGAGALPPDASFVEASLLRHWPGNVRELLLEARDALQRAQAAGAAAVDETHLDPHAGVAFSGSLPPSETTDSERAPPAAIPDRERIEAALRAANGQVLTAAKMLGLQRNQLRRWLSKNGVDPRSFTTERSDG
jgi:transcriptional regulator with GAF, ATPase, and Fis domain